MFWKSGKALALLLLLPSLAAAQRAGVFVPPSSAPGRWATPNDVSDTIGADQNNYAPTGIDAAVVLRITASGATRSLTGLRCSTLTDCAAADDGRRLLICNLGSNDVSLTNQSSSSTAANRFDLAANTAIKAHQCGALMYDGTSLRWRQEMALPNSGVTASTVGDSVTVVQMTFDAQGRVTNATPVFIDNLNTDTIDIGTFPFSRIDFSNTLAGNPALGAGECTFASGTNERGLICEGATADAVEIALKFPDPTSTDKTVSVPNETTTLCGTASVCSGYQASLSATKPLVLSGATLSQDAVRDVRSDGAVCDGSTNDTTAIQATVDALTTAGGTLKIAGGLRCAIASSVTLKANVRIECEGNAGFKALSGATTLLSATAGIDNVEIRGCVFDLNAISTARAIKLTGSNTDIRIENNQVFGAATGSDSSHYLAEVACGTSITVNAACYIRGNTITGSNTAAKNDTCLGVKPTGFLGIQPAMIIANNVVDKCGDSCVELQSGSNTFELLGNTLTNAKGGTTAASGALQGNHGALYLNTTGTGLISGNLIYAGGALDHVYALNSANVSFSGANHIPTTTGTGLHFVTSSGGTGGGSRIIGNYVAGGIWFDAKGKCATGAGACTGAAGSWGTNCACDLNADCQNADCGTYPTTDHFEISTNVTAPNVPPCGASLCIENMTTVNITNIIDVSNTTTAITRAAVKITQLDNTADGPITVSNSMLKVTKTTGTIYAVWVTRPQGTGDINGLTIFQNYLGTCDQGIKIDNAPTGNGWVVRQNNATNCTRQLSPSEWPGSLNTGLPADDALGFRGNIRNFGSQRDTGVVGSALSLAPIGSATAPSTLGSSAIYAASFDADQPYTSMTTKSSSPTSGDDAYATWPATLNPATSGSQFGWKPLLTTTIKTDASVANVRIWCGWFSANTLAAVADVTSPALHGGGFRYDTGADTGATCSGSVATCWRTWSNDGGADAGTVTIPTLADALITASTKYVLQMDMSSGTDIKYFINGGLVATHTTNLPTATTNLAWMCGVSTLTSAQRALKVSSFFGEFPY